MGEVDKYLSASSFIGSDDYNHNKRECTSNQKTTPDCSVSRLTLLTDKFSSDDGSSDDGTASKESQRPWCHKIFGCGPSQSYPTSEIRIKTSDLSPDILHAKSDVSSCSSDGTFREYARGEKNIDEKNHSYIQSRGDNHLLDSNSDWNQMKTESDLIWGHADSNEETSVVSHPEAYNLNSNSRYEDKSNDVDDLHLKSSSRGRHKQRDDMRKSLESKTKQSQCACGIGEAFHKIGSCMGRFICHEEDDDIELINKLEKQESNSALSQGIPDRTDQVRLSYITRSTYSIIKMDNLYETQDLFDNESIFNKSSISLGNEGELILSPTNRSEIFREYDVLDSDGTVLNTSQNDLTYAEKNNLSSTHDENIEENREVCGDHSKLNESSFTDVNERIGSSRHQRMQNHSVPEIHHDQTIWQFGTEGGNHVPNRAEGQQVDFRDVVMQLEGVDGTRSAENGFISDDNDDDSYDDYGNDVIAEKYRVDYVEDKGGQDDDDSSKSTAKADNEVHVVDYRRVTHVRYDVLRSSTPNSEAHSSRIMYARTFANDQVEEGQQVDFRDVVIQLEGVDGTRSAENGFISDEDDDDNGSEDANDGSSHNFIVKKHGVNVVEENGKQGDDDSSKSTEEADNEVHVVEYRNAARVSDGVLRSSIPNSEALSSRIMYAGTFAKDQVGEKHQVDFRDVVIQLEGVDGIDGTRSAENSFISDDDDDDDNGSEDANDGSSHNFIVKKHGVNVVEENGKQGDDDSSKSTEEAEDEGLVAAYRRAACASDDVSRSSIPNSEALSSRTMYAGTFAKDEVDEGQQVDFRDVVIQLEGIGGTRSAENGFISDDDDDDDGSYDGYGNDVITEMHGVNDVEDKGEHDDDDSSKSAEDEGLVAAYRRVAHVSDGVLRSSIPNSEALSIRTMYAGTFANNQVGEGQQVDFRDVVIQLEGVDGTRSAENGFISDDDDDDDDDREDADDVIAEKYHVEHVDDKGGHDDDDSSKSTEEAEDEGLVAAYKRPAYVSDGVLRSSISDSVTLSSYSGVSEGNFAIHLEDNCHRQHNEPVITRHQNDSKDSNHVHAKNSSQVELSTGIQRDMPTTSISPTTQSKAKGQEDAAQFSHITQDSHQTIINSSPHVSPQKLSTIFNSNSDDLRSSSVEATRRRGTAAILSAANELISKTQSRLQIKSQISELQKMLLSENNETHSNSPSKDEIESPSAPLLDTASERLKARKERLQKRRERIEQMRQSKGVAAGKVLNSMDKFDDENTSDSARNQASSDVPTEKGMQSTSTLSPNVYHQMEKKNSSEKVTTCTGSVDVIGYRAGSSHHLSPTLEEKSRKRALMFQKFRLQLDKAKAIASTE
jgi:hypothetical protein